MKLLLTSAGLVNPTIVGALEQLIGKPLSDSRALYVPTAIHASPGGAEYAWQILESVIPQRWGGFGILELTALESLPQTNWMPSLTGADAVLVGGGNTPYLSYWFRRSGFADVLPDVLASTVYVGVSAGSLLAGSGFHIDAERLAREGVYDDDLYGDAAPAGFGSDETLALVDFAVMPHLHSPDFTALSLDRIAANTSGPAYVIDDRSAVAVDGDRVTVVSEGEWHRLGSA